MKISLRSISFQLPASSFQLEVLAGGWRLVAGRPVVTRRLHP